MLSEVKQKYILLLIGASIMVVAFLLFVMSLSKMVPFPPVIPMDYVIIIFGILGIHFGISSGKKLAYTIHDRDIILEHIKRARGRVTVAIGTILQIPIMFTALTTIIWTLFVIGLSLSRSAIVDSVLIGTVRWVMIISMLLLITGSFLFYKARSSDKTHMLTLKGRLMMKSGGVIGDAMRVIDNVEDAGRDVIHHVGDAGKDMIRQAGNTGRDIVYRVEDEGKDLIGRIRGKL